MINIPIDEHSSIIQPYYDGGESYIGHSKYSLIDKYTATPQGSLSQTWVSFSVKIKAGEETTLEYECGGTNISEYSRFRIFGMIPKTVNVRLYCNGELVMDKCGNGTAGYTDSDIKTTQKEMKTLKYVFKNSDENDAEISLFYLGMLKDDFERKRKNPYTSEWEGCFADNPNYGLYNEIAISKSALETLRKKVTYEPYKTIYAGMRKTAEELMKLEPENMISKTVREYHMSPRIRLMDAEVLAVCGQIEENKEMLKMACRYALSLACCENWCADVMETVQTVTWHHRSFDETDAICAVSTVISLAGGVLSWHGLNLLYNAIIMKGLPRIDADFMTMDYIYKCNQGLVFMKGYLFGLAELIQRYPRYKIKFDEAKILLEEMFENSFAEDGGYQEGALYWRFIMMRYLNCVYLISRAENKSVKDLIGDKLDKTAEYGLANLDANAHIILLNDSSRNVDYGMMMPAMLYSITGKNAWAAVANKIKYCWSPFDMLEAVSVEVPEINESFLPEFAYFESAGLTVCTRNNIQFAVTGGPSNDTHAHRDKGSFIINVNGAEAVAEISCGYDNPAHIIVERSESHSLAVPVINGKPCEQCRGAEYEAPIDVKYSDGVLNWKCNTTQMWNEPKLKCVEREIISNTPNEYIITDRVEFEESGTVQFKINIAENAQVKVTPKNWTPTEEKTKLLMKDENQCVYQKILTSETNKKIELVTVITI